MEPGILQKMMKVLITGEYFKMEPLDRNDKPGTVLLFNYGILPFSSSLHGPRYFYFNAVFREECHE